MIAKDRDLLVYEPNVFVDMGFAAQRLMWEQPGNISGTTLTVTGVDFAALGVSTGHVVICSGLALEVVARVSATALTVSLIRADPAGAAVAPVGLSSVSVSIWSFGPQLAAASAAVLASVQLVPGATVGARLGEDRLLNAGDLRRLTSLMTLEVIFAGAMTAGAARGSLAQVRLEQLRAMIERERQLARASIDVSGDGVEDEVRRPSGAGVTRA
jgi:hypothetical protein